MTASEEARGAGLAERMLAAYPDLAYRDVFWSERRYEDRADRLALRALLPRAGGDLLEVGAGFGRLADEYAGYRTVTLMDTSEPHVVAARDAFGGDPRVRVVLGDAYQLPFPNRSFDALVCVRVLHHIEDPAAVFAEFGRVLRPGGVLLLEFANKRNLKAIVRFWLRLQRWSPFDAEPYAFKPLHLSRHPAEVRRLLRRAGFRLERRRAVSLFSWAPLSRHVPVRLLAVLERPLQSLLAPVTPGPSEFLLARRA